MIVSVPKVENPKVFGDLRPISLCNFCFKVISKLLNTRLAPTLPIIISEEQIIDNIMLAQEMIQKIDSKVRDGNLVLKLDLAKSYDRLSWLFLTKVLGLCEVFNGQSDGFFSSSRGVRQGGPFLQAFLSSLQRF